MYAAISGLSIYLSILTLQVGGKSRFLYQDMSSKKFCIRFGKTKSLFGIAHNSFMSCCKLFFFCQTLISKTVSWMKLFFFFSHKDMSWDEAKKVAYCSSLPHFSLSSMHEVVGEAILPNTFSKTAQLHLESCS